MIRKLDEVQLGSHYRILFQHLQEAGCLGAS